MKKLVITGGNWTSNGNFSGYDREVGRVHFFGAQMRALGYEKDSAVAFPLYGIGVQKEFDQVDEEGNPTGEKFTRWQANSLFKERKALVEALAAEDLIQAHVDSNMLTVEIAKSVKATASSAGLSEAEVEALLEATI